MFESDYEDIFSNHEVIFYQLDNLAQTVYGFEWLIMQKPSPPFKRIDFLVIMDTLFVRSNPGFLGDAVYRFDCPVKMNQIAVKGWTPSSTLLTAGPADTYIPDFTKKLLEDAFLSYYTLPTDFDDDESAELKKRKRDYARARRYGVLKNLETREKYLHWLHLHGHKFKPYLEDLYNAARGQKLWQARAHSYGLKLGLERANKNSFALKCNKMSPEELFWAIEWARGRGDQALRHLQSRFSRGTSVGFYDWINEVYRFGKIYKLDMQYQTVDIISEGKEYHIKPEHVWECCILPDRYLDER